MDYNRPASTRKPSSLFPHESTSSATRQMSSAESSFSFYSSTSGAPASHAHAAAAAASSSSGSSSSSSRYYSLNCLVLGSPASAAFVVPCGDGSLPLAVLLLRIATRLGLAAGGSLNGGRPLELFKVLQPASGGSAPLLSSDPALSPTNPELVSVVQLAATVDLINQDSLQKLPASISSVDRPQPAVTSYSSVTGGASSAGSPTPVAAPRRAHSARRGREELAQRVVLLLAGRCVWLADEALRDARVADVFDPANPDDKYSRVHLLATVCGSDMMLPGSEAGG
ncbi:hypothetical protein HK405_015800, partial [Cladochytrium tenue]